VWKKLFILVSVVSGVMCVVTVVLWARSFVTDEMWGYKTPGPKKFAAYMISYSRGLSIGATWTKDASIEIAVPPGLSWQRLSESTAGWSYQFHHDDTPSGVSWHLALPHCVFVAGFGLLPSARVVLALRRRRQQRAGLCRVCGYDLRATPERCPECGAEPRVSGARDRAR
jgi:hypothetical protein